MKLKEFQDSNMRFNRKKIYMTENTITDEKENNKKDPLRFQHEIQLIYEKSIADMKQIKEKYQVEISKMYNNIKPEELITRDEYEKNIKQIKDENDKKIEEITKKYKGLIKEKELYYAEQIEYIKNGNVLDDEIKRIYKLGQQAINTIEIKNKDYYDNTEEIANLREDYDAAIRLLNNLYREQQEIHMLNQQKIQEIIRHLNVQYNKQCGGAQNSVISRGRGGRVRQTIRISTI